ncbi:hypothetical protein ACWD62_41600 [Streptomyces sp. NPDC005146]
MTEIWEPLSTRGNADTVLQDEPSHALAMSLREWIEVAAGNSADLSRRVLLRCGVARPDEGTADYDDAGLLAWYTPHDLLLDAVDALLDLLPTGAPSSQAIVPSVPAPARPGFLDAIAVTTAKMTFTKHRTPLQQLLDDGRSAYTIRPDGRALIRRVNRTLTNLVTTAASHAEQPDRGSAATHLRRAYATAYALHPDPVRSYSEAIKAVEAAAHATLQPNNAKATLGTMLGQLSQQQLTVALAGKTGTEGAQTVEAMMRLLWTGQTSRHGGLHGTRDESPEEARMAVQIAAVLVDWFSTGIVR